MNSSKIEEEEEDTTEKYIDSVTVRISDELRIKADGVVIFPQEFHGNTVPIRILRNGLETVNTRISSTSTTTD